MKLPLSVIVISRDSKTRQEVHSRYDTVTGFPRLKILLLAVRAAFSL